MPSLLLDLLRFFLSLICLMEYPSTLCIFLGSAQFFILHHIYLCEFTVSPPKGRYLEDRVNFEIISVTSCCLVHTKNSIFVPWVNNCLIPVGKKWQPGTDTPALKGDIVIFNGCKDNVLRRLFHFAKPIWKRGKISLFGDYQELFNITDVRVSRFGIKSYPNLLMKIARLQNLPLLNDME